MNNIAKLAIGGAAVLVVAIVGYSLLPALDGAGSVPSPTPSPTAALAFPRGGTLAAGRYPMILDGHALSLEIATPGWSSNGSWGFDKGIVGPDGASFIFWPKETPIGVYADPCKQVKAAEAGPSIASLAEAVAGAPWASLVSGPTDVTVGGYPAKQVVITIPEDPSCSGGPSQFYLWHSASDGRYVTAWGDTLRVWIVDVDGSTVWIDGETHAGASPDLGAEMQRIINSVTFE